MAFFMLSSMQNLKYFVKVEWRSAYKFCSDFKTQETANLIIHIQKKLRGWLKTIPALETFQAYENGDQQRAELSCSFCTFH